MPKGILLPLKIKRGSLVNVFLRQLRSLEDRPLSPFAEGKVDLLYFVPKITSKGYDIIVIEEGRKIRLWYRTPVNRPDEVVIKRYVPISILKLFGYLQAEGGKIPKKLRQRSGLELNFTNKLVSLHKDAIELAELMGINRKLWKIICIYNPAIPKNYLKKMQKEFIIKTKLPREVMTFVTSDRVKTLTFKIYINKTSLFEVINKGLWDFRKLLPQIDDERKKILYLRGLIAGDGSIGVARDKSLHVMLKLFEQDKDSANDYLKILNSLGIHGTIRKDRRSEMYIVNINGNWKVLEFLFRNKLFFDTPTHRRNLLKALTLHDRYRMLIPLRYLKKERTTHHLRK